MRLPSSRQCGAEGDGKKMDQAPPIRNPFVHVLKFTPLEKAKVKSGDLNGRPLKKNGENKQTSVAPLVVRSSDMLLWSLAQY